MTRSLELDDLFEIRQASDPQLHPDGAVVAYVVTVADKAADRPSSSIWIVAAEGGTPRPLTNGPADREPRWSPDGATLAFVGRGDDDDATELRLLPTAGGEPRAIACRQGAISDVAWSPDGQTLAFTAVTHLADAGDSEPVVVDRLDYKADGAGLLGSRRRHLFVIGLEDREPVALTWGDFSVAAPAWSPDGARLAFAAARHADRDLVSGSAIWLIDAGGGPSRELTPGEGVDGVPTWSPDGAAIAFVRGGPGHARLFTTGLEDGRTAEVPSIAALDRNVMSGGPGYPGARPRFTADGAEFLVCVREGGCTHLYRAALDSNAAVRLAGGPEHSVSGLSQSASGDRLALVVASPVSTGEVMVDGAVVASHTLEDVDLIAPSRRLFAAPDATEIEGWVVRAAETSGASPLLLDIHGGPHNAWSPTFDGAHLWHQVLAARGWTVLFVNSRGSDGYGEDFYRAVNAAWGTADAGDYLAAVDSLIDEGLADADWVAVTGYSYGGYQTCWLTATTDRFVAAIAGGCLSNLTSSLGTSDACAWLARNEFDTIPGCSDERLTALSPTTYVDGVTTPTLILHGEADQRCPIGQAEEWFAALRARRVPVELVRYPGASHLFVLSGRPSHRLDYCRRVIDWVERHTSAKRVPASSAAPRAAGRLLTGYTARLDQLARRHHVPGASVAVLADGEIVEVVSGRLRTDRADAVTPGSAFQIGSVTKVFTTSLVMQLVDAGLVELDAPVRRYLPAFRLAGPDDAAAAVTVRQLLTHTSGIEGDWFEDFGTGDDGCSRYVDSLGQLGLVHPVGAMFSYCNSGFVVAGRLIEVVTGQSYAEALTARLLRPLGIDPVMAGDAMVREAAVGHLAGADGRLRVASTYQLAAAMAAAGSTLAMTARDLLAFAGLHLNGGRAVDGTELLSAASVKLMQERQVERAFQPNGEAWGLGWGLATLSGERVLRHAGGTIGQHSVLYVLPDRAVAVAVLTNAPGGLALVESVVADVLDAVAGVRVPPAPAPPTGAVEFDAGALVGHYENIFTTVVISSEADGLLATMGPKRHLDPEAPVPPPRAVAPIALDATTFILPPEIPGVPPTVLRFLEPGPDGRHRFVHTGRVVLPRVG